MSWLESIIKFLNLNSGAITALATVILVIITWWYVRLTKNMLKATNTPEIQMFLYRNKSYITLCLQNVGPGFASDIKFIGDLSLKPLTPHPGDKPLKEFDMFKNGIAYLGTGHKAEIPLFHMTDLPRFSGETFDIIANYKDSANTPSKKTFHFKIGNWDDMSQFRTIQTDEIADNLKGISATLNTISKEIKQLNSNIRRHR